MFAKPYSQYRGVCWDKGKNKWSASIWDPNLKRKKKIGTFPEDKEIDAARAYDREAIKREMFGKLNFYDSTELLENTSVAAVAAIANATVVGSAGASTSRPTSKFVGISYDEVSNSWRARITIKNVRTSLGYYVKEEDAAHAYAVARRGIEKIPEDNNLIELLSYRTTNEANVDELLTVRPRYTSDLLVQTTVLFYRVIIIIIIIIIYYCILALIEHYLLLITQIC
jgi:hypothetical protein